MQWRHPSLLCARIQSLLASQHLCDMLRPTSRTIGEIMHRVEAMCLLVSTACAELAKCAARGPHPPPPAAATSIGSAGLATRMEMPAGYACSSCLHDLKGLQRGCLVGAGTGRSAEASCLLAIMAEAASGLSQYLLMMAGMPLISGNSSMYVWIPRCLGCQCPDPLPGGTGIQRQCSAS
jgi:hypothetical protein